MTSVDYQFMKYVSTFNKMYATVEEFAARKEAYAAINEEIEAINSNPASTHVAGHNKFSDWTPMEKEALFGLKNMTMPEFDENVEDAVFSGENNIDWRAQGKVTAVKDQA